MSGNRSVKGNFGEFSFEIIQVHLKTLIQESKYDIESNFRPPAWLSRAQFPLRGIILAMFNYFKINSIFSVVYKVIYIYSINYPRLDSEHKVGGFDPVVIRLSTLYLCGRRVNAKESPTVQLAISQRSDNINIQTI